MTRSEVFRRWAKQTFDTDSWFSVLSSTLDRVEKEWEQWDEALFVWGVWDPDDTPEEARAKLEALSPEMVIHIGEALQNEERNIAKEEL